MSAARTRLAHGTVRIAVAEDDAELREVLAETLRERGLEVVEATDGATLLAAIRRGGIALVVTDHMMPGLAGGDVIGLCRLTGDRTPFVVVTGAPHAIIESIRTAHDVRLLRKPFTCEALLDAVAEALEASRRGREQRL